MFWYEAEAAWHNSSMAARLRMGIILPSVGAVLVVGEKSCTVLVVVAPRSDSRCANVVADDSAFG